MSDSLRMEFGAKGLPDWVPGSVRLYLEHTEMGLSMRRLAQRSGCHASTVMRQIRKLENRRDDRLVDEALKRLCGQYASAARAGFPQRETQKECQMIVRKTPACTLPNEARLTAEALRILPRLCETTAVLAVAAEMEKAVVVREDDSGNSTRTAVVDRDIAEAMALKDWIDCTDPGRISRYHITAEGRAALTRLMAQAETRAQAGFTEAPGNCTIPPCESETFDPGAVRSSTRRNRYNAAESPMMLLARRKDREGNPFLSADLVAAGERLREDFELSRMETLPDRDCTGKGPETARERVANALRDLGPGLGDVALRCCCYLEGLETAEKRMGWSARSGKIVLRIALQRLKMHYDSLGETAAMIG